MSFTTKRPLAIWIASIIALIFGAATLRSGGLVLFTEGEFHQQQGNYVPFVVWFNFIAGFGYIIAAVGLLALRRWSAYLAFLLAAATVVVFALFGLHVLNGGPHEMQTFGAMTIRTTVWVVISVVAHYQLIRPRDNS
jgi:hypothetical protein